MKNLTRIIGPAPSELSLEELERKLSKERERVTAALDAYKQSYSPARIVAPKKRKETSDLSAIKKAADEVGISVAEYLELAKEVIASKKQMNFNFEKGE